jgi:hypothetical protein
MYRIIAYNAPVAIISAKCAQHRETVIVPVRFNLCVYVVLCLARFRSVSVIDGAY